MTANLPPLISAALDSSILVNQPLIVLYLHKVLFFVNVVKKYFYVPNFFRNMLGRLREGRLDLLGERLRQIPTKRRPRHPPIPLIT